MPESGIIDCSARHDKNFPLSSIVGVKLNIDVVTFPSDDIWENKIYFVNNRRNIIPTTIIYIHTTQYTHVIQTIPLYKY